MRVFHYYSTKTLLVYILISYLLPIKHNIQSASIYFTRLCMSSDLIFLEPPSLLLLNCVYHYKINLKWIWDMTIQLHCQFGWMQFSRGKHPRTLFSTTWLALFWGSPTGAGMDEANGVIPLWDPLESPCPLGAPISSYPWESLHCTGSAAELQPWTGGSLGLYSHCSAGLCQCSGQQWHSATLQRLSRSSG